MTKVECYAAALRELEIRLEKGGDLIADLGNAAAVLKKRLGFFWVGFYFVAENQLILGPFQGTPACVFLPLGAGVCGTCASKKEIVLIPNVRTFSGHIACDPDSQSEIAVPVYDTEGRLCAVLDADHKDLNAFDETDRIYLDRVGKRVGMCWKPQNKRG